MVEVGLIKTSGKSNQHLAGTLQLTQSSKDLVEKTLVASSKCLFQVLSASSSSEVLESSMWIVGQLRSSPIRPIRLALYQGAKDFVETMSEVDRKGPHLGERVNTMENHSEKSMTKEVEVFITRAILALLQDNGQTSLSSYIDDPENLRRARVSLGLAAVNVDVAQVLPLGELESLFNAWLTVERSRPLRDDIQKAIRRSEARR